MILNEHPQVLVFDFINNVAGDKCFKMSTYETLKIEILGWFMILYVFTFWMVSDSPLVSVNRLMDELFQLTFY